MRPLREFFGRFRPGLPLALFFAAISAGYMVGRPAGLIGIDARIYYRASAAWLNGADPWAAFAQQEVGGPQFHFAALPPTVAAFAPFAWVLTEEAFVWLWVGLSSLAALYVIRRLVLPWWWLMFPPLVEGVVAGNPQIVLLALLLSPASAAAAAAPLLKIYAFVPLVGERRVRALAVFAGAMLASLLLWDLWQQYVTRADLIAGRIQQESHGGFSAWVKPEFLLVPALIAVSAIAVKDLRAAGWLALPAVFPSTQFHLSTMAMPVARHSQLVAILLALPIRGLPAVTVILYAAVTIWTAWRARMVATDPARGNGR